MANKSYKLTVYMKDDENTYMVFSPLTAEDIGDFARWYNAWTFPWQNPTYYYAGDITNKHKRIVMPKKNISFYVVEEL